MEVSIVISVYNCEKYLSRAIRSALDQNFPKSKYEIIVVDDGSTDSTPEIIKSFGKRIRPITLKDNHSLAFGRNVGIKNALGQFVFNLDADDYIHADCIFIEQFFLKENPDFQAVSCDYYRVNEGGVRIERVNAVKIPIACGIMFRKDNLIEIGLYDEKIGIFDDIDLRKRYLDKFNIYNIALPLYRYRMHENNLTKKKENKYYKRKLQAKHNSKHIREWFSNHKNARGVVEKCC